MAKYDESSIERHAGLTIIRRAAPSANGRRSILWTKEQKRYIKKAYNKGASLRELGKFFGLPSYGSITLLLESEGWLRKKPKGSTQFRKLLAQHWKYAVELYQQPRHSAYMVAEILAQEWKLPPNTAYPGILAKALKAKNLHKVTTRDTLRSDRAFLVHAQKILDIRLDRTDYHSYRQYLANVRAITETIKVYSKLDRKPGLCWDHIYSIFAVYHRNKPLNMRIVCHPANLQQLMLVENAVKMHRCDITLKELKRKIVEYNEKHGDPFVLEKL